MQERYIVIALLCLSIALSSILLLRTESIKAEECTNEVVEPKNQEKETNSLGESPFISSLSDIDSIDCAFYLEYDYPEAHKKCRQHLKKLKDQLTIFYNHPYIKKYKTCAVIASGANLLKNEFGEAIDATEKTFRMNEAPTEGYEKHVGSRTDFRLVHPGKIEEIAGNQAHEHLVFAIHEGRVDTMSSIAEIYNASKDFIIHPQLLRDLAYVIAPYNDSQYYISMIGKYDKDSKATGFCSPSSGIKAIQLALKLCENVEAYGFSLDYSKGEKEVWSYYRSEVLGCKGCWLNSTNTKSHCFRRERDVMQMWEQSSLDLFGSILRMVWL